MGGSALIRLESIQEAQWLVDNVNDNCPAGLDQPIKIAFADASADTKGGKSGSGKDKGKGKGKDSKDRSSPYGNSGNSNPNSVQVTGLPPITDELTVYKLFTAFGAIQNVDVKSDWNGVSACVRFVKNTDLKQAISGLNKQVLPDGGTLIVTGL